MTTPLNLKGCRKYIPTKNIATLVSTPLGAITESMDLFRICYTVNMIRYADNKYCRLQFCVQEVTKLFIKVEA